MENKFVVINDEVLPTNTVEECESAESAAHDAGLSQVDVWAGDPDCPDSYRNGQKIFGHGGARKGSGQKPRKGGKRPPMSVYADPDEQAAFANWLADSPLPIGGDTPGSITGQAVRAVAADPDEWVIVRRNQARKHANTDSTTMDRCVLPGQCLMPGPHSADECHDVAMVEAQHEQYAVEMREWPAEKWAEQLRMCAEAITEDPARRQLTLTSLATDINAAWPAITGYHEPLETDDE